MDWAWTRVWAAHRNPDSVNKCKHRANARISLHVLACTCAYVALALALDKLVVSSENGQLRFWTCPCKALTALPAIAQSTQACFATIEKGMFTIMTQELHGYYTGKHAYREHLPT